MKNKLLIGISGLAGTGKTTAAEYLVALLELFHLSFADTVKHACASALDIPKWEFEQLDKEIVIADIGITPRQFMQAMGKSLRDINNSFLIQSLERKAQKINSAHLLYNGLLVSDVRTEAEACWIRQNGGTVIHIRRQDAKPTNADHTEKLLMVMDHDHVIRNDSTLEELHNKLKHAAADIYEHHCSKAA